MSANDIDAVRLGDLRVFVEVARTLNYTRAAASLDSTEPTVYRRVKALENIFGVDLFVKVGRGIALSSDGARLLRSAKEVLERASELHSVSSDLREMRGMSVVVGAEIAIGVAGDYLVPRLISQFRKNHPDVDIRLEPAVYPVDSSEDAILKNVASGAFDVGLFLRNLAHADIAQMSRNNGLKISSWFEYPMTAIVGAQHFDAVERRMNVEKRVTCVAITGGRSGLPEMFAEWEIFGLKVQVVDVPNSQAMIQRVIAEPAVAVLRHAYVEHELRTGLLRTLPSPADSTRVALCFATRVHAVPAATRFIRFLESSVAMAHVQDTAQLRAN